MEEEQMNSLSRRDFMKTAAMSCAALASPLDTDAAMQKKRILEMIRNVDAAEIKTRATPPNIIFIFADDWGYGDLGIHGSSFCKTPHLDQLAKEGIDFENFTVNSPVCSPSRAAVMTGHFPGRNSIHQHFAGVNSNKKRDMPDWLDPDVELLPKVLKGAGYTTGHFGKWHLGNASDAPSPSAYGYDEYRVFNAAVDPVHEIEKSATSSCVLTADFIRRHKDKSFFINLWLHETHLPHLAKRKYLESFKGLDERKSVYAAVVAEADDGVGIATTFPDIVEKLEGQVLKWKNSLPLKPAKNCLSVARSK